MAKNQSIAKVSSTAVVSEMPEFMRGMTSNRGTENVAAEDLIIPRLEIVQSLSPARKKTDPAYIEGAEEGMLYNNVTRHLYSTEVTVVPVMFKKDYLIWKDRKSGGGFRGAFPTEYEARAAMEELNEDGLEIVDTPQQFCLLIDGDRIEEIVVSMPKSKAKVSRQWNSLIRMAEGDSFTRAYKLTGYEDTNRDGETYQNIRVTMAGFVSEAVYKRAEALYAQVSAGAARASSDFDTDTDAPGHTEEF